MQLSEDKKVFIYIGIAFVFSIAVRMIWVYQFYGYEPFMWNGQFMINTNDGYYWAEGAHDIIAGFHQPHDLSPVNLLPSILTAYLYKVLPFSFESILFYLPAVFGSLVVIPIILIAHNLKRLEVGFVAALLAGIAWSYYNRTLVGYFDTDILNIVLPIFLLWSLMLALRTKEEKYLLFTALEIIVYRAWYPQSYSLEFAFFVLVLFYTLYKQFKRKEEVHFELSLLAFMLFAMMGLESSLRLVLVVVLYVVLKKEYIKKETMVYLFGVSLILFFVTGGFTPIWEKLKIYIFRDSVATSEDTVQLHFFTVMQTIREAGKIPFEVFANRISGHTVTFLLSIVGYIRMVRKYPVMLLGLPMVGLGFLAYVGGLRFTIYAVPVLAFGISFLIFEVSRFFHIKMLRQVFLVTGTLLILLPNIWHVWQYKVPTVFVKDEVKVLDRLKHIASREDYVLSWWDYGYPIRYYSDVKTLVDGGEHSGDKNFPVSFALTKDMLRSAKMARLDVEYTERKFKLLDEKKIQSDSIEAKRSNIVQMMIDNNFSDANDFLEALALDEVCVPEKTRDVYYYLPKRMLSIFPTVAKFSDIDLVSGKQKKDPLFLPAFPLGQKAEKIFLKYQRFQFVFDVKKAQLDLGGKQLKVSSFIVTQYNKNGKLRVQKQLFNLVGDVSIIYMKNYNIFLILDNIMLDSTYVRLFILEDYDKKLFEPVLLTPLAKVYKLKL